MGPAVSANAKPAAASNSQRCCPSSAQLKKPATTIKVPAARPISLLSVRDKNSAVGERANKAAASKHTRLPNWRRSVTGSKTMRPPSKAEASRAVVSLTPNSRKASEFSDSSKGL